MTAAVEQKSRLHYRIFPKIIYLSTNVSSYYDIQNLGIKYIGWYYDKKDDIKRLF